MSFVIFGLVLVTIAIDAFLGLTAGSLVFMGGLMLVYTGERLFAEDPLHWVFTLSGLIVAVLSLGLRWRAMIRAEGERRAAHRQALLFALVALGSLAIYGLSTDFVTTSLGFDENGAVRWTGSWKALFPIVLILGLLPMFELDRVLWLHPVHLPMGAKRRAMRSGVALALAISLIFPVNYLGAAYNKKWDTAYFRVTDPGTATIAAVSTLSEPVEATLFFSPGSDVVREMRIFFDDLEQHSSGKLIVKVVDQAVDPRLAEELKVRENGYVALRQGDTIEKFKIGVDMDKARRELKKLDETVQKHLLKISRGARTAYMMVGHGEASSKEKDDPLRKLTGFKGLLEGQNYKIKSFGVTDGSTDAVPDDAALLVIAAPGSPLLPEEEPVVLSYLERGGRLLALVEPGQDRLDGLLGQLGLKAGDAMLANANTYLRQNRGIADRVLLMTDRYGTHESVTTLSKNKKNFPMLLPTVTWLDDAGQGRGKKTVLIRTLDDTWADRNGNFQRDPEEKTQSFNVAYAITGELTAASNDSGAPKDWRAIVMADVSAMSDKVLVIQDFAGNRQFVLDAVRWLVGDEELSGTTENEEDVKIAHTREQDIAWFYGTTAGVPLLLLAFGLVITNSRRRSR